MPNAITDTPRILALVQDAAPLSNVQATAAYLWLHHNADSFDPDHSLRDHVDAYWRAKGGEIAYALFLRERGSCHECGTGYKYENLSICPHCFATYCPAHKELCRCGHPPVG